MHSIVIQSHLQNRSIISSSGYTSQNFLLAFRLFPPIKKNCILTINRLILRVYVCAHMFRYETLSRAFTRKCLKINKQTTTEVSEIHYFMIISATIHKTQWQYNKTNKFNSPLRLARFFLLVFVRCCICTLDNILEYTLSARAYPFDVFNIY